MKEKEYISLIPTRDQNNAIQWTMIHDGKVAQGANYPDVDLEKGSGNSTITFTIIDLNRTGIKFDPELVDGTSNPKAINAIWITEGSNTEKVAGPYPSQIDKVQLQSKATELVVGDKNSAEGVFTYQLNFVNPANTNESVTPIDPEIRNGGTGRTFTSMDAVAAVLGLAVLLLTGLLWVGHLRNARAAKTKS
jgi:hypothetical protein